MEELIFYLNEIAKEEGWPLSLGCMTDLRKMIKRKRLKQGDFLLRIGEVCRNMYFIEEGLLKCFYDLKGVDVVDWFFGERETVVSVQSFYDQLESKDSIQALEDCDVLYVSFDELRHLYRHHCEFNAVGRVLTNKYLCIWNAHARNLRMLKAHERYELMLKNQPELVARIPVVDLASFLGMTRETLSRMRSRLHFVIFIICVSCLLS